MLVIAKYIGHTSHTGYSRGTELDDLKKKWVSCRVYQHAIDKHDGNIPVFQINVTGICHAPADLRGCEDKKYRS